MSEPIIKLSEEKSRNFESIFNETSNKAEKLRKELIDSDAFGIEQDKKESEINSERTRNVASFAFCFFDEQGYMLRDAPFFFRPSATQANVTEPFFFFSGRCHRQYQTSDSYEWAALAETAIKEDDLRLLEIQQAEKKLPQGRIDILKNLHGEAYIEQLQRLETHFISELKILVWRTCDKEPFFDYLRERKNRRVKSEICESFEKPTMLNAESIKHPISNITHYAPTKDSMYFVHSEQFALYQMANHLDDFMEVCKGALGEKFDTISKLAVLIYTRNTMCARCSHSIITDFCHSGDQKTKRNYESFVVTINNKFNHSLQFSFLASARYKYASHVDKLDNFERYSRRESIVEGDDKTYNPDSQIIFQDSPNFIYHHHMPDETQLQT